VLSIVKGPYFAGPTLELRAFDTQGHLFDTLHLNKGPA
jgi:hypothetical protein